MKLNIDKCISFVGKFAWSIVIVVVMLQALSIVSLWRSLYSADGDLFAVAAVIIQLLAIMFFALFRFSLRVRALDKAGGLDTYVATYLAEKIEWPNDPYYAELVDNCGVRAEFEVWFDKQNKQISIGEFDQGLSSVIGATYSLPQENQISDTEFLLLAIIKLTDRLLKWMSLGCMLFAAISIAFLFNPVNTLRDMYPFIVLPFCLAIMFHCLGKAASAKRATFILQRPLTSSQIDGLMRLASSLHLHKEFCALMRSPRRPDTAKDAHTWLLSKTGDSETFFG